MSSLVLNANIAHADEVYQALMEVHQGLDEQESRRLNARLILILLNQIGDRQTILEAINLAAASPEAGVEAGETNQSRHDA